jgi:hypothetical protein
VVAKKLGGQNATQFQKMWPMVQKVLSRFDKLTTTSYMKSKGMSIEMSLSFR